MARFSPNRLALVTTIVTLIWVIYVTRHALADIQESRARQTRRIKEYRLLMHRQQRGFRTRFSEKAGVTVWGWPSKGGVYVLEDCFAIELDFLKLDRFHDTPPTELPGTEGDADEEEHCNRMRQLGAIWWKNQEHWSRWKTGRYNEDEDYDCKGCNCPRPFDYLVKVGWPAGGGVWVLNITRTDAYFERTGVIHNADDMEHRCRLIEQLGGVFYENPKDWLDTDMP